MHRIFENSTGKTSGHTQISRIKGPYRQKGLGMNLDKETGLIVP